MIDTSASSSDRNMEAIDTSDRNDRDAEVSDSDAQSNSKSIQSVSIAHALQQCTTHHHSGTTSMLPVHSNTQLQVILPMSSQSEILHHNMPSTHLMTTILKSGTIEKKNYAVIGYFS